MAPKDQSPQPPAEEGQDTQPHAQPPQSPPQPSSADGTGPPLPSRHTAATPGPRAQRFQDMFSAALNHTLTKISADNFASCYPTVAAQAPGVLDQVQRSMVDRFADLCNQEFGRVQARYGVVPKLNELEALVSDAERRRRAAQAAAAGRKGKGKARERAAGDGDGDGDGDGGGSGTGSSKKPTPPHMLPAGAVLAAHLAPHLASQQSQMNAKLQNTQAANAALWGEVQKQRAEADELLGALERALADVGGAAALLDEVPAEELARESRTVEAEMTDV